MPTSIDWGSRISWAAARALPEGDPGRPAALADVARRLENLAESGSGPAAQLNAAADVALQLERPGLAARIFERAAQQERGDARAEAFANAARWHLAAGDRAGALKLLDAAAKSAYTHKAQSELAVKAIKAAEASGDPALALEHASAWVSLRPNDARLLAEAARLALAANRPRLARDLGRRLVRETPADTVERDRQALRELAAGDPAGAWPWVEEAARRHPNSREWREREAHAAEWTGSPGDRAA